MARLTAKELRRVRQLADHAADPLERIRAIRKGAGHWDTLLQEAVEAARREGIPWERIADALGVTRQAVTKRFKVSIH